jgi:hypothetical protein
MARVYGTAGRACSQLRLLARRLVERVRFVQLYHRG